MKHDKKRYWMWAGLDLPIRMWAWLDLSRRGLTSCSAFPQAAAVSTCSTVLYLAFLSDSFRLMYRTGRSTPHTYWDRTAPSPLPDTSVCRTKGRGKLGVWSRGSPQRACLVAGPKRCVVSCQTAVQREKIPWRPGVPRALQTEGLATYPNYDYPCAQTYGSWTSKSYSGTPQGRPFGGGTVLPVYSSPSVRDIREAQWRSQDGRLVNQIGIRDKTRTSGAHLPKCLANRIGPLPGSVSSHTPYVQPLGYNVPPGKLFPGGSSVPPTV